MRRFYCGASLHLLGRAPEGRARHRMARILLLLLIWMITLLTPALVSFLHSTPQ